MPIIVILIADWFPDNYSGDIYKIARDFTNSEREFSFKHRPLLELLRFSFSKLNIDFIFFMGFYISLIILSYMRLFQEITVTRKSFYILLIITISNPFFWSIIEVTISQGLAFLIVIFGRVFHKATSNFKALFFIIIACLIHESAIVYLLCFLIIRFFSISALSKIFTLISILYISNIFIYIPDYLTLDSSIFRALSTVESDYEVGFSLFKFVFTLIPLLLLLLLNRIYSNRYTLLVPFFKVYLIIASIGFILSGFPYHDRILILCWLYWPLFLIPLADNLFLKNKFFYYSKKV